MSRLHSGWRQPIIIAAFAAIAGGCSADVSRFDFPASLSLNDSDSSSGATGTIPAPTEPVKTRSGLIGDEAAAGGSSGQAYYPAPSSDRLDQPSSREPGGRDPGVSVSALPDATSQPAASRSEPAWTVDRRAGEPTHTPAPVAALSPAPSPAAPVPTYSVSATPSTAQRGEMVEVRPGDTLYGLSKRHKVSLNELMTLNDLKGPNLKPGQKLYLPDRAAETAQATSRPAELAAAASVEAPADWTGTYIVRPGESLYAIARQNGIKPADLQKYNGITDVRRIKPNTVLKVPANVGQQQVAANTQTRTDASPYAAPASPVILNSPAAAAEPPAAGATVAPAPADSTKQSVAVNAPSSAAAGPATDATKLRWPAQGKVIAGFGPRSDGTHNDGINLSVPLGTEVHAAEGGVVAYAGNELKGYGNLILLRHDNGWVTAYAHSEELLVKRGDKIKRGQVIAKAGKTGHVDQPQVHFELRQGQRPVDPTPYMEKM